MPGTDKVDDRQVEPTSLFALPSSDSGRGINLFPLRGTEAQLTMSSNGNQNPSHHPCPPTGQNIKIHMGDQPLQDTQLSQISNFIWGVADDYLRDLYVRGKYRDVILSMTVLRRLDAVLEPT